METDVREEECRRFIRAFGQFAGTRWPGLSAVGECRFELNAQAEAVQLFVQVKGADGSCLDLADPRTTWFSASLPREEMFERIVLNFADTVDVPDEVVHDNVAADEFIRRTIRDRLNGVGLCL